MQTSIKDLPSEILVEILSRLPDRSLVQAKCVCKTFSHAISPDIPFPISRPSSNAELVHVLHFNGTDKVPGDYMTLLGNNSEPKNNLTIQALDFGCSENEYRIVNACNGLLYLVNSLDSRKDSIVYNPITKEYLTISLVKDDEYPEAMSTCLGFCPVRNRYKVLKLVWSGSSIPAVKVLTIGSNCWHDVKNTSRLSKCNMLSSGVFLEETIYWVSSSHRCLDFFNFEKEEFGEIEIPSNDYKNNDYKTSVAILQGCLSVSYSCFYNGYVVCANIWMLKKDANDQKNWTVAHIIDMTMDFIYSTIQPVQVLKNGEILMISGGRIVLAEYSRFVWTKLKDWTPNRLSPWWSQVKCLPFGSVTPDFVSLKYTLRLNDSDGIVRKIGIKLLKN